MELCLARALLIDTRYAVRALARNKTFSVTAVLTLGAGLALASVAFTLFNAYVLRPFAVADPGSLYEVHGSARTSVRCIRGATTKRSARAETCSPDALASRGVFVMGVTRHWSGKLVSGNYFPMLGRADRTGPGDRGTRRANTARRQRGGPRLHRLEIGLPPRPRRARQKDRTARPHLRSDRGRRPGVRRPGRIAARFLGADLHACSLPQGRDGSGSDRPAARRRDQGAGGSGAGFAGNTRPARMCAPNSPRAPPSSTSLR